MTRETINLLLIGDDPADVPLVRKMLAHSPAVSLHLKHASTKPASIPLVFTFCPVFWGIRCWRISHLDLSGGDGCECEHLSDTFLALIMKIVRASNGFQPLLLHPLSYTQAPIVSLVPDSPGIHHQAVPVLHQRVSYDKAKRHNPIIGWL